MASNAKRQSQRDVKPFSCLPILCQTAPQPGVPCPREHQSRCGGHLLGAAGVLWEHVELGGLNENEILEVCVHSERGFLGNKLFSWHKHAKT